jgi:hypothetical protein
VATVLGATVQLAAVSLWRTFARSINPPELVVSAGELIVQMDVMLLTYMAVFRIHVRPAFVIWIVTLPVRGITVALTLFLVIPHLASSLNVDSSRNMAPTLLGKHGLVACPLCGAPAYVSLDDYEYSRSLPAKLQRHSVICGSCFLWSKVVLDSPPVERAEDQVLVDRLSAPKRWDVVVFQKRGVDHEYTDFARLVALPNETVLLSEGALWINERREPLPDSRVGLVHRFRPEATGAGRYPKTLTLSSNEYFVVVDSSIRAGDFELSDIVPRADISGIARYIYWPPARWRSLR